MRSTMRRLEVIALFALYCAAGASSAAYAATSVQPAPPRVVPQAVPLRHGHRLGPHHIFGTILAINGNVLSVQRRNGKFVSVDATTAVANDDYSYPLFVGKTVAIDGTFTARNSFVATHIEAVTTLQSLEVDK